MDNQQQFFHQTRQYNDNIWVDSFGNTYNTSRKDSGLSSKTSGYLRTTTDKLVHRMVAEVFLGEIPPGYVVNHKDGNKNNNSVENLEIVSQKENRIHSIEVLNNSRYGGFITRKKKLSYSEVVHISSLLRNSGISFKEIARMFGVSSTAIQYINCGRNYKWLTEKLFNDYPLRSRR